MSILPPPGEPWSRRTVELSNAERYAPEYDAERYAPEYDTDRPRPPAPVPFVGGTTDGD